MANKNRPSKPSKKVATRRATRLSEREIEQLEIYENDKKARAEGPVQKKWTVHDFKGIKPKGVRQISMFETFFSNPHVHFISSGSAGTGKTFLSMWLGLQSVFSKDFPQEKLIIVRSAVPSRDIGFLPGDSDEKLAPYTTPYKDILTDLTGKPTTYEHMVEAGKLIFMPTSFLRGTTWHDAIVIIDEVQNMTFDEINTVMTRVGRNTRVFVCGDIAQNDFNGTKEESGFHKFVRVANLMDTKHGPAFEHTVFTRDDIQRSGFVKSWIVALEDVESGNHTNMKQRVPDYDDED
jgi:phosphate starvation-inducible PhoH-like protein